MPTHAINRHVYRLALPILAFAAVFTVGGCSGVPAGTTTIQVQESGVHARFRGVAAVNQYVAWASGTGGTVVRTTDGGLTWANISVPEAPGLDFRDVEAFDDRVAYISSSGTPARIYKTIDGGATWHLQFERTDPAVFLNAIAFWDANNGLAVGDPIDGQPYILRTANGGNSWIRIDPAQLPWGLEGEVGFAGSGTNLTTHGRSDAWIGFGGPEARVWHTADRGNTWSSATTSIAHSESAGVFSIDFFDGRRGVAVGGDYAQPDTNTSVAAVSTDRGRAWAPARVMPSGYRSVVRAISSGNVALAAGPNGVDVTSDSGNTWQRISSLGFHSASFVRGRGIGWAVGDDGRVAFLTVQP